ncbi:vWA domain-containing protein [Bacillus pseudomycoides]|uniref:vWA domain-containing protein n=1 Tax=Bacillus pseudomycoides TaxID=64104 RepID=UPI000BFC652A|nr:VWA domain-containing protein [Bacillus pseudomycoides]PGS05804.1 amino acid dehydrogenase [Bacillus pseudomycoides]
MKKLHKLTLICIIFIFCNACSTQTETTKTENKNINQKESKKIDNEKQVAHSIPVTFEEIVKYPNGKYNRKYKVGLLDISKESEPIMKEVAHDTESNIKSADLKNKSNSEQVELYVHTMYSLLKQDITPFDKIPLQILEIGGFEEKEKSSTGTKGEQKNKENSGNYNIEILLDASGSMAGKIGGEMKMDIAKEAIQQFVSGLPENVHVSLRVYGHKGSNDEKDKAASCGAIENVYTIQKYDQTTFRQSLDGFQPVGWTPLAEAIKKSTETFQSANVNDKNILYIVSDGVETCGGNPVEEAQKISNSNIKPIMNIVGFQVDNEAEKQLKEIAEVSKGKYVQANNAKELQDQFKETGKDITSRRLKAAEAQVDINMASVSDKMKLDEYERKTKGNIGSVQIAMKYTVTTLYKDKKISQELAEEIEKRINDLVEKQEKQVEVAYSQFQEKVRKHYEEMSKAVKSE